MEEGGAGRGEEEEVAAAAHPRPCPRAGVPQRRGECANPGEGGGRGVAKEGSVHMGKKVGV